MHASESTTDMVINAGIAPKSLVPQNHLAYAVPSRPSEPESLTPHERRFALALFFFGMMLYFVVNIHRVAIPGQIFSELQAELDVSASAVVGLGTSFMYIYAVTQLLVGVLVDRYGGMRVLVLGGIVMSLGTLLFAFSPTIWMLYASRGLIGFGCACAYLSLVKECARLYPSRFTTVLGFVILFGYSGGIAGTYPFLRVVQAYNWRIGMLSIAALGGLVLVGIAFLWRHVRKPLVNHEAVISFEPYRCGFSNVNNLKGIFSFSMSFGLYFVVLTVIGKKFLEDVGGLTPQMASLCCTAMVLLSAISNQVSGILSTLMGNRRRSFILWQTVFVPVGSLLVLTGLLFLPHGAVLRSLLVVAFLLITMAAGFSPVTNAFMLEANPTALTCVGVGISNFSAYAFVALFSSLAGAILDLFSNQAKADAAGALHYPDTAYLVLFGVFLLIGVGAHAIARHLPETYGRNINDGAIRTLHLFGFRLTLRT